MRKLILALYTCLSFIVFTSCSIEGVDDSSTILGEWTLTSLKVDTPIDLNNNGTPQSELSPGCLTDSALNFLDASKATVFFSSEVTYHTRMDDGKLIFMTACSTDSDRAPTLVDYTMNNNLVMIDFEGELRVLTLNESTLIMTVPDGFVAKDIDTFETTFTQDITYVFTR
jgi:hypothetical protein